MRVTCSSIEEFLENIQQVDSEKVYSKVIFVSLTRRPLDGDKRHAARFQVVLQVSAVINDEEGGQYLLLAGEDCGIDYEDATQEKNGSDAAAALQHQLMSFCDLRGLGIRPGNVSE